MQGPLAKNATGFPQMSCRISTSSRAFSFAREIFFKIVIASRALAAQFAHRHQLRAAHRTRSMQTNNTRCELAIKQ
jgi:hypothetical protein